MEKLKMHSPNFTDENIAKLAALFPNCVTEVKEGLSKDTKQAIDWDLLKQELSDHIVEGPQERYHLNWPGKKEALLTANAPIAKTLRPCPEDIKDQNGKVIFRGSVDFDTTENLFIEGDNLDALKLLQETYLGKVKMIYIDPPYNTGKDFIYADNFAESTEAYLEKSNQKDEEGNRLVANTDSNGRFHSDWLSMMYSRLKLARNMLKDDGVIFISIDDNEVSNIKKLGEEIFGCDNFLGEIIWQKRKGGGNDSRYLAVDHEAILIFCKEIKTQTKKWRVPYDESYLKRYREKDEIGRFYWDTLHRGGLQSPIIYDVKCPDGSIIKDGTWQVSKESFDKKLLNGQVKVISKDKGKWTVLHKVYLPEGRVFRSIYSDVSNTDSANELKSLFFVNKFFENPKPSLLLKQLITLCGSKANDIILDFFAGSATTAHAVMQLNAEDGGNRKFIMVQLPEECDEKTEAFKAGYKTIAEISKERIRRAGKKIQDKLTTESTEKHGSKESEPDLFSQNNPRASASIRGSKTLDTGFRVLKVDSSNMADVYYSPDTVDQASLFETAENIKSDRTEEDLLFQVLLDWGIDLTLPIRKDKISNNTVFFVDNNALAACFAKNGEITEDFCKELAQKQPLRVVFRDSGFASDDIKINAEQIFKLISPHTEVKTI